MTFSFLFIDIYLFFYFSEFQYTVKGNNEISILEINLDRVRALYLQRSTMTIINYFRDHFIEIINGNIEYGKKLNENNENIRYFDDKYNEKSEEVEETKKENKNKNENGNEIEVEVENEGEVMIEEIQKIISSLKIKRLCVRLSRIEVLVPLSSQGTDAICFAVPTARIFKFYEKSEKQFSTNFMKFNKNYFGGYKFGKYDENNEIENENEINDNNCYNYNDDNNYNDGDNNDDEGTDNNNIENENGNKKFHGNDNRINFSTVSSCDSDTPGLSYFRGPLLSGNKRISEYGNILKSVKNLNSSDLRNTDSEKYETYFTENKSDKTNFNVDVSHGGEDKIDDNEDDDNSRNDNNNNNNNYNNNNNDSNNYNNNHINWKLLDNIFDINKWDDMGINNYDDDINECDNHNINDMIIINNSSSSIDVNDINNVNTKKIKNDNDSNNDNNDNKNHDYNNTQTINSSSSCTSSSSSSSSNPFGLRIEISKASISSWCNDNLICDDINILGALSIDKGI